MGRVIWFYTTRLRSFPSRNNSPGKFEEGREVPSRTGLRSLRPCRPLLLIIVYWVIGSAITSVAQTESASISGRITDSSGEIVQNAKVTLESAERGTMEQVFSNQAGIYLFPAVRPGIYHITVLKQGFLEISLPNLTANVQAHIEQNFSLREGATSESITASAGGSSINTKSGSLGAIIDSQFVSNLPLNGRTFQTLIEIAPGVVLTPTNNTPDSNNGDWGQFSVNGMRANGNYITVDGVSGNFGLTGTFVGFFQATSGSLPATNVQGSYTSLISADALQEFRIQTSTFAPEFGRTPGSQISLVTKAGTNLFHASAYDYLRNDVADAKDWFDSKKPPLRFNDFGADFSGPIWKNKTFFFFSYEGQSFVLPQPTVPTVVPSSAVRQVAPNPTALALLNAFPLPNGPAILDQFGNATDGAIFSIAYSNPNHSDSYSLRIDHSFNSHLSLFARYNQAPSNSFSRSPVDLATATTSDWTTRTATLGSSQPITNAVINELRLNASEQVTSSANVFAPLGGAKAPDPNLFLPGLSLSTSLYGYGIFDLVGSAGGAFVTVGTNGLAKARSVNIVDNLSYTHGKHAMKFGFDYRWYSPVSSPIAAHIQDFFLSAQDLYNAGVPNRSAALVQEVEKGVGQNIVAPNYSFYGQDTLNLTPRLVVTYGLRWEVNPAPHAKDREQLLTLSTPPDLSSVDQSGLQLAPIGKPYYKTEFDKFAPRAGAAYQLRRQPGRELVVRGGWGLFYDLNSTPFASSNWPYLQQSVSVHASSSDPSLPVPVLPSTFNFHPPNFTPSATNRADVDVAGKGFTVPRIHQWYLEIEQSLGINQAVSIGYVGSAGRKLLRSFALSLDSKPDPDGFYFSPNFLGLGYIDNASYSDYHSLQAQFRRNLAKGLQVIANYTWSHSTDDVSTTEELSAPGYLYSPSVNHGASSFDVRHSFTASAYYEIASPRWNKVVEHVFENWALSGTFIARTGLPFNIEMSELNAVFNFATFARRPNLVPGVPLILSDSTAPGGWRLNTAVDADGNPVAFTAPVGNAQGNMGRNSIYGFGAWQSDLAIHRKFRITERIVAELRWEAFNFLNHPNFMNPDDIVGYDDTARKFLLTDGLFGKVNSTMARGFSSNGAGLNPLFQIGASRSMQLSARISF